MCSNSQTTAAEIFVISLPSPSLGLLAGAAVRPTRAAGPRFHPLVARIHRTKGAHHQHPFKCSTFEPTIVAATRCAGNNSTHSHTKHHQHQVPSSDGSSKSQREHHQHQLEFLLNPFELALSLALCLSDCLCLSVAVSVGLCLSLLPHSQEGQS